MSTTLVKLEATVRGALSQDKVDIKGKDILVTSKDRITAKENLEKYLKKKKIEFISVFKKSKSSSLEVLTVEGVDIIFKPFIIKGAGGLSFEKELAVDLENYFSGVKIEDLKHKKAVKELQTVLGWTPREKYKVLHEGSKNQKRALVFSAGKISISNSTGVTLTDLTLQKGNEAPVYLSLKMSKSYYTLSASIFKYFLEKNTQVGINTYFGFDGMRMGGFGKEYQCKTPKPNYTTVKANLQNLLSQAIGTQMVLVHQKDPSNVLVKKIGRTNTVSISNLSDNSYVYPEPNVRKYANIKVNATINGGTYAVHFQFRGTTAADKGPKYLRILLERM